MVSPKLASALKKAKALGRNGDTMLAHINPKEATILKSLGGSGTVNPHTGLPQFDNPSMGSYDAPSSSSNYSNYTGGSDLGGYSGSGNTTYSGGGGGGGGGGGKDYSNYTGGSDLGGYSGSGNTTYSGNYGGNSNSSSNYGNYTGGSDLGGYSAAGNTTYSGPSSAVGGGSSMSTPQGSAASSFGSALSAGAGMAKEALSSFNSGMTSLGDTLSGWMGSAAPAVNEAGTALNNRMLSMSDTLNNGLANGYSYAQNYISNALNPQAPQQGVSYTQMAANPGFRSEAASGDPSYGSPAAPQSFPSIDGGPGMDPNSYIGGSRLVGYEGSGNTIYSGFGTTKGEAERAAQEAPATYNYTPNPDVSYGLRFNPGTIANAEYIKGAQIKDQFPNVDFGGRSNTEVGKLVTRTIAGEAANEGDLGQQLVGTNIMNRLALANSGIGLPGNFKGYATFNDVMKGYDANGMRRGTETNSVFNNPGANTEWNAFNAMSNALSPNAAINQARTNPMAAMELGAQYGVDPAAVANAVQSTHYYNPKAASPSWGAQMANAAQVGNHLFGSLDTSPKSWNAINGLLTGNAAPNPGSQYAGFTSAPSPSPAPSVPSAAPAPSQVASVADPNAQVEGGSGNYLGQVGTDAPHSYEIDSGKLIADIRANNFGSGLLSDQSIIDKVIAGAPPGSVSYNADTGKLSVSIGDVNSDGTVDAKDTNQVLATFKEQANVDPRGYAVAIAPPAREMNGNIGTQFAQPNRPITPTPSFAYASPADVPSPDAATVADVPPQFVPNRPFTPTPAWAYNNDAPVGVDPNKYAAPLTLPAQPNKALGAAIDAGFGMTPLGIPNTLASLFGYSVGDMAANGANVPMTPEEALAAENRMIAQGEGKGSNSGRQDFASNDTKDRRPQRDVIRDAKTKAKATTRWKQDALAWGFSQDQIDDPEVADLIKQIYDMGFIPKSA